MPPEIPREHLVGVTLTKRLPTVFTRLTSGGRLSSHRRTIAMHCELVIGSGNATVGAGKAKPPSPKTRRRPYPSIPRSPTHMSPLIARYRIKLRRRRICRSVSMELTTSTNMSRRVLSCRQLVFVYPSACAHLACASSRNDAFNHDKLYLSLVRHLSCGKSSMCR